MSWFSESRHVVTPTYQPRDPSETVLYQVIAEHLETFRATLAADPTAKGLPDDVQEEFDAYLRCGILAHGFVRLGCDSCPHQMLLAFSCKKRGFCLRVPPDAWLSRQPISSSRSSPGCRRANGSSRCPFPCVTGWHPPES